MTKEEHRLYMQTWRATHREKKYYQPIEARKNALRLNHKITLEQYNEIFIKQNGLCAICHAHQSSDKRSFAVDHDHVTGSIRGLLCFSCNISLGHFKDNVQYLENAIEYLKRGK